MSIRVTPDLTPKVEIKDDIKEEIEAVCERAFSSVCPKLTLEWGKTEMGAELLCISVTPTGRLDYVIRFEEKDLIECSQNYGSVKFKAKSVPGLYLGMKLMLQIEKQTSDLNTQVFD